MPYHLWQGYSGRPSGEVTIKAVLNFCAFINAAKYGEGRASVLFWRTHNNSQGVNDVGVVPDFLPGYLAIYTASQREKVEKIWGRKLPESLFRKDTMNVIELALNGKLKAFYVMGENPIVTYPYGKDVREACKKLDFMVVQDTYLTETVAASV